MRNRDRVSNRDELDEILEPIMRRRTKSDWLGAFREAGVPCGPINDLAEVFRDEQVLARSMVQEWAHAYDSSLALVSSLIKMSETPAVNRRPPP